MRNATTVTIAAFGFVMAIAGFEHGVGEVL